MGNDMDMNWMKWDGVGGGVESFSFSSGISR